MVNQENSTSSETIWRTTVERLATLLRSSAETSSIEPTMSNATVEPILLLNWRSAVSEDRGESFLGTTSSGALVICEGTPQQVGKLLWSSASSSPPLSAQSPLPPAPAAAPAPSLPPKPAAKPAPAAELSPPPAVPYITVPSAPATPGTATAAMQEVFVSSRQSGKRLAVESSRSGSGARLVLQSHNGGAHQRFFITPYEGGYQLSVSHSPLMINAAMSRRNSGWQLIEMAAHKGGEQVFTVEETAEGDYRIRAPQSGRWLATANVNGTELPVLDASQGDEQASRWIIHSAPATPRLALLDLQSVAPRPKTDGALDAILDNGQLQCVDKLAGAKFHAYAGDFLKRGRDQLLLVRAESKYHYVEVLDFGETGVAARVQASAVIEPGGWIDGWLGKNDLQLIGDLVGDGSSQMLLLHKGQRRPGEQAVLMSLQQGVAAPRKLFSDNWGERQWLDGWLDPEDVHMVGDFMGLGYDQWLMMNRHPRGGRVRIMDIKGGSPRRCYTEMWGQSTLLDGWMDQGRILLAGDFLKRGHAQVLFLNRDVVTNSGKVLIADFCRAAPPAEVCYRELWGQSDLLNDFLANGDTAVAGDFMGRGYAQVLFVSRKGEGEKFLVADFHRGAPPLEPCVREQWGQGQRSRHESLIDPRSVILSGRFRRPADGQNAPAPAQVILL